VAAQALLDALVKRSLNSHIVALLLPINKKLDTLQASVAFHSTRLTSLKAKDVAAQDQSAQTLAIIHAFEKINKLALTKCTTAQERYEAESSANNIAEE